MTKTAEYSLATIRKVDALCKIWEVQREEISKRANLSERTVIRWFQMQTNNSKVFHAARELIVEKAGAQEEYAEMLKQSASDTIQEIKSLS